MSCVVYRMYRPDRSMPPLHTLRKPTWFNQEREIVQEQSVGSLQAAGESEIGKKHAVYFSDAAFSDAIKTREANKAQRAPKFIRKTDMTGRDTRRIQGG